MRVSTLRRAISEAERFLTLAKELEIHGKRFGRDAEYLEGGERVAAVKRASMDLTKALPQLRRYDP